MDTEIAIAALIVSLLGLVFSTYVATRDRATIRQSARATLSKNDVGTVTSRAVNAGRRPIELEKVRYYYRRTKTPSEFLLGAPSKSVRLEEGQFVDHTIASEHLESESGQPLVRVAFVDPMGREYVTEDAPIVLRFARRHLRRRELLERFRGWLRALLQP